MKKLWFWFIGLFASKQPTDDEVRSHEMYLRDIEEEEALMLGKWDSEKSERMNLRGVLTEQEVQNILDEPAVSPRKSEYDDRIAELAEASNLFSKIMPGRKCTCDNCDTRTNNCIYAYDAYNTDGDCLAIK